MSVIKERINEMCTFELGISCNRKLHLDAVGQQQHCIQILALAVPHTHTLRYGFHRYYYILNARVLCHVRTYFMIYCVHANYIQRIYNNQIEQV